MGAAWSYNYMCVWNFRIRFELRMCWNIWTFVARPDATATPDVMYSKLVKNKERMTNIFPLKCDSLNIISVKCLVMINYVQKIILKFLNNYLHWLTLQNLYFFFLSEALVVICFVWIYSYICYSFILSWWISERQRQLQGRLESSMQLPLGGIMYNRTQMFKDSGKRARYVC